MRGAFLCHGIVWSAAGPQLALARPDGSAAAMDVAEGTLLGFRVLEAGKFCLGSHRVQGRRTRHHVPCPLQAPAERGYQCINCFLNDDLRFLHDAHRSGVAPDGLRAYLGQPHWLYVATFASGASKVGTASDVRKQLRLAEQGAAAARYVARAEDGRIVRVLEDMVSQQTELTQAVRSTAKLSGLQAPRSPAELDSINAEHARTVRNLLSGAELEGFATIDQTWELPEPGRRVMGSESRTAYPLELAAGGHGLRLDALLGSIALVRTREGGPAYLADLNGLKGRRIELGSYQSQLPPVQVSLF
jgi:hypothetical protein